MNNSNLLDPILLNSSFYQNSINPNSGFSNFLKPFTQYSFSTIFINVLLPIGLLLIALFILKLKYDLKKKRELEFQQNMKMLMQQTLNYNNN